MPQGRHDAMSPAMAPTKPVPIERVASFPPISDAGAHTLILGSMPGVESLRMGQYYAHPRNAFWRLIGDLTGRDMQLPYPERVAVLLAHGIAVWDVLDSCVRRGSLDTAIDPASIRLHDFRSFYSAHPQVDRVFFNGAYAEATYQRHVPATLAPTQLHLRYQRLPSTSPANATHRYRDKLAAWRAILPAPPA